MHYINPYQMLNIKIHTICLIRTQARWYYLPRGSVSKSMSTVPASAYAITRRGDARQLARVLGWIRPSKLRLPDNTPQQTNSFCNNVKVTLNNHSYLHKTRFFLTFFLENLHITWQTPYNANINNYLKNRGRPPITRMLPTIFNKYPKTRWIPL